ncbi:hypothetical protein RhiirA4_484066 [Rhizophagus irregularis]|uniref:RNase H type-1 domain-containing protein n=1 Tax=Rhizophagus irregularis TaxID=588596 RepID=A0A2I1HNE9_9GLOM|nr:hypothetical protein RhiirA4_484066 [Rhizophagus irregularis]
MFKNKLKFARSAPNAILDNPYIYGYRDFYENQLQAKITDFCIQLNDNGLLGKITHLRLKSLQNQLWSSRPLIEKLPYDRVPHSRKNNYIFNMLLLCYENNISFNNLDNDTFSSIQGGKIPLLDIVDNAFYSAYRVRLREKNILFLDQIISGDKTRLLLWKEILLKSYVPGSSNNKEAKWYSDIKKKITQDNIHLDNNIVQLFGQRFDNVEDVQSYDIVKKDRSLVALYNPRYNSVIIGKVQGVNTANQPIIQHYHVDMVKSDDFYTQIFRCENSSCQANEYVSNRTPCAFIADWRHLVPLISGSQFSLLQIKIINYNIFHIFDFAKKKFELLQTTLTQNHVTSLNLQENIILDLLEPSTSRNDLLVIQQTLASFDNSDYYIFEFFTDGSLIDLGSEQCSISCAFAQISDLFDLPHVEFSTTIDKWPSAYRGELLAVILALCVVPRDSKVRINTDSLNVITQFDKLKKSRFTQTSREYFKCNNNFLWAILCRIVLKLNLHVEMFKVIAHGEDIGNNYVDKLAKEAHLDQDRYIIFRHDAVLIKALPCWNGIVIENRLRAFIKTLCNFKGLEKFINLNRNYKYRRLEVDWTSTFQCLNGDIVNNETSISSSKTKAQKVHLLIEEIPTIEQMKKSLFDLYDGWKCPMCGMDDETFDHVWSCDEHRENIKIIRDKTINQILTWMLEYNDNVQDFNAIIALNIWDISHDPNSFTFIDLIKGIIPMSLFNLLNTWTTKSNTLEVLMQMRQFIFNEIFENVWIPRCSYLKEFERSLGITKKKKLTFKNIRSLPKSDRSVNDVSHQYDALDSIHNYIYFGKNIIEFYTNLTS